MYRPPSDPRDRPRIERPTWQQVLLSYAMVAALPVLLWVASEPLVGTAAIATAGGLFVGGRRAHALVRCFDDCEEFAFDLGGRARVTVRQLPADEVC